LPPEKFVPIWEDIKDMGVLMGKGGLYGNVSIELACSRLSVVGDERKRAGEKKRED